MQKTFKNQQGREFLLLELPSDASEFELSHFNYQKYDYTDDWTLVFKSNKDNITYMNGDRPHRHLPKGNYQILCLAKDATEEQCDIIIDKINKDTFTLRRLYMRGELKGFAEYTCIKSKESLTSLLTSLGFKQDDNVLILEKI